jgi:TatD DNase family protein
LLIDSHCHLDGEEFAADREAALDRAAAAGLTGLVAIGGGAEPAALACGLIVARAHQGHAGLRLWATVGVHPHDAGRVTDGGWEELNRLARDPLVVAVGEIGLDYHYDHAPREVQRAVFERQLALAAEAGLPVSIHCREAFPDCLDILAARNPPARGVFHCFTGSQAEADAVLALGWYLSFSGVLTFTKAGALRAVARTAPADRILVETDAPYLAPAPHRGRRNEPAFVAATAARLAEIRGVPPEELAALTSRNFFRLFSKAYTA